MNQTTVDVPDYPAGVLLWAQRAQAAAQAAMNFSQFASYFFGRDMYDCRIYREGKKVDGEWYDGPLRQTLWEGTEEERKKGFFMSLNTDRDETENTHLRTWTLTTPLGKDLAFIPPDPWVRIDGHPLKVDPAQLAYDTLPTLGACERIFITDHTSSGAENAVFFFPFVDYENGYLMVKRDSRYMDTTMHLFQGNPEDWARANSRGPRGQNKAEMDVYFSDEREKDWPPFFEAPVVLELEPEEEPRAVQVTDYARAVSVLTINNTSGDQIGVPCLYRGGA